MNRKRLSLRTRIIINMILLVLVASVLIAAVTIYQYREEAKDYHKERLERKEAAIKEHIDFILNGRENTYEVTTENIPLIFKDKIFEIDAIHKLQINLYDLDGQLLKSSKRIIQRDTLDSCLDAEILNTLSNTLEHRYVVKNKEAGETFQSSYSYITDDKFKNLAILNLPYLENDDFLNKELKEFLTRLAYAYLVLILVAIIFAYFISNFITKSLRTISDKMNETRLEKRNKKIQIESSSEEIETLVNSYNSMIDELEASAVVLATNEREQAWREMAKQVAHEIKNPLTPMRLTVQSFQRKFDPDDENINQKVNEYSNTLIQQIDTMSSIASAFSNFAKMPAQKSENLNVVHIVKLALDIFNEGYIEFHSEAEEIIAKFDRTQLIRVVTNLVKNGIQAIPNDSENPKIDVRVFSEADMVNITIEDNGSGIEEDTKAKIFEPKFTTKSSGMGLGLAMVKNIVETYNGSITFTSQLGKGTVFKVTFPAHQIPANAGIL
nr:ATP-binding protein [Winogradskyella schleiferi]